MFFTGESRSDLKFLTDGGILRNEAPSQGRTMCVRACLFSDT